MFINCISKHADNTANTLAILPLKKFQQLISVKLFFFNLVYYTCLGSRWDKIVATKLLILKCSYFVSLKLFVYISAVR